MCCEDMSKAPLIIVWWAGLFWVGCYLAVFFSVRYSWRGTKMIWAIATIAMIPMRVIPPMAIAVARVIVWPFVGEGFLPLYVSILYWVAGERKSGGRFL